MFNWHTKHAEDLGIGDRLADLVTTWTGSFNTFIAAVFVVLIWGILGPHYEYSDTWQLVINTSTTIVTFLMVFLIQNNQNRQAARDRLHADADYQTNLRAKEEIEALQLALARIETEKLDQLLDLVKDLPERIQKVETDIRMIEYRNRITNGTQ